MGYAILNKDSARCVNFTETEYKQYKANYDSGIFYTTDINIAFRYRTVCETIYPLGSPFRVVEVDQ